MDKSPLAINSQHQQKMNDRKRYKILYKAGSLHNSCQQPAFGKRAQQQISNNTHTIICCEEALENEQKDGKKKK